MRGYWYVKIHKYCISEEAEGLNSSFLPLTLLNIMGGSRSMNTNTQPEIFSLEGEYSLTEELDL